MGKHFTVHKCHTERGSEDDVTAWITLHEAQALFDKKGLINSILALECICANQVGLEDLRNEISAILPDTQAIEVGSKVVARAEARLKTKKESAALIQKEKENRLKLKRETERFASITLPLVLIACVIWIAYLGFTNVKDRETELGILRSLGYRSNQIMILFLSKSLIIGLAGGFLGYFTGTSAGVLLGLLLEGNITNISADIHFFQINKFIIALTAAVMLSVIAGWLPALWATQKDPAAILQKE
jgi:ABC-type lipoprotein release transport system permease subunit